MNMKNKGKLKENVLSTPCLGKACTGFAVTPPVSGDHDAAIARGVRFSHYWFPSSVACPSTHYATHRLTPLSWSWPPRHTTRQTLRRSNTHTHTDRTAEAPFRHRVLQLPSRIALPSIYIYIHYKSDALDTFVFQKLRHKKFLKNCFTT